jgi:Flp pilus assembly protein TadG
MIMKTTIQKFLKDQKGVAAIEMAFIYPFMILLYFGLVDITGFISFNRKVTSAASLTADLVSQRNISVLKPEVDDMYNAVAMIMSPTPMANVRVDVLGLKYNGTDVTQNWMTSNTTGPVCPAITAAALTSSYKDLMSVVVTPAVGATPAVIKYNDLVVARVCMTYTPYVAQFMGNSVLGADSYAVNSSVAMRPRSSLTLTCYTTTVVAGTKCS